MLKKKEIIQNIQYFYLLYIELIEVVKQLAIKIK